MILVPIESDFLLVRRSSPEKREFVKADEYAK